MSVIADREFAEPELSAKVAFLSSGAAYGQKSAPDIIETRMAWVFLVGNRVFKLKKPIKLPYLDLTSLAARHFACSEEVRLNRRLALDVYLGLKPLTLDGTGTLSINGDGHIIEWLVEMQRLPDALFLDNAIRNECVSSDAIASVGCTLAEFYLAAPPVEVDPKQRNDAYHFELGTCRDVFLRNEFSSTSVGGVEICNDLEVLLDDAARFALDDMTVGRIVEGHGDLRPEHVHLSEPPLIIDCLEFSRDLRLLDPFEELAYLSMECAVMGARWIGPRLIEYCSKAFGIRPDEQLIAFYTAYRATLRARQALFHLLEPSPRTPEKWRPLARAYLEEAERAMATLRSPTTLQ